jgi:hypothetical protein
VKEEEEYTPFSLGSDKLNPEVIMKAYPRRILAFSTAVDREVKQ